MVGRAHLRLPESAERRWHPQHGFVRFVWKIPNSMCIPDQRSLVSVHGRPEVILLRGLNLLKLGSHRAVLLGY